MDTAELAAEVAAEVEAEDGGVRCQQHSPRKGDLESRSSGENSVSGSSQSSVLCTPALSPAAEYGEGSGRVRFVVKDNQGVTCVGKDNQGVTWGLRSVIGRRKQMEDAVAVVPEFMDSTCCGSVGGCTVTGSPAAAELSPVHFFGVYDGHGGSEVSDYCSTRLHDVVREEWVRGLDDGFEWHKRWELAFSSGFERVDSEILNIMKLDTPRMIGSTAVSIILSACQIIASNCGDSRAVLCRGSQAIPLTVDHKPDRVDERMRIEREGGKIVTWNGDRVFGILAMSRAIGDWYMRPWITPVPEVTFTTRSKDDECVILATDGLWDVIGNNEVGEFVSHVINQNHKSMLCPAQVVANRLTQLAFSRNSSDNISVLVVDLKSKRGIRQRNKRRRIDQ